MDDDNVCNENLRFVKIARPMHSFGATATSSVERQAEKTRMCWCDLTDKVTKSTRNIYAETTPRDSPCTELNGSFAL